MVTGADIDTAIIERARRVYGTARGWISKSPMPGPPCPLKTMTFDVVVSFETIEHIAEHSGFIADLANAF